MLAVAIGLTVGGALAVTPTHKKKSVVKTAAHKTASSASHAAVASKTAVVATAAVVASKGTRKKVWVQTWDEPTYKDSASGDQTQGDDPVVRQAAMEALGPYNGSVVVADPTTGRVLTIVNQQLALGGGFQPCSTVKVRSRWQPCAKGWCKGLLPPVFTAEVLSI